MGTIYRWNEADRKAELIAETEDQPMVMGFAKPATLLIVANERAAYSLNVARPGAIPQPVHETAEKRPDTVLLLPVGLHNMLSVLNDLMERRDYVYRQGSNTAVIRIVENAHRGYFYAGDERGDLCGRNLASASAELEPGGVLARRRAPVTSEDDGRTYRVKLETDGTLTASLFAERGGTSVASDEAGNVYIAGGQIYVYDRRGKQIGVLELPERPGSLAFGGPDTAHAVYRGPQFALFDPHCCSGR